jgi:hypothetical protein
MRPSQYSMPCSVRFGEVHYYRTDRPVTQRQVEGYQKTWQVLYPFTKVLPNRDLKQGDTLLIVTPGNRPAIDRALKLDYFNRNHVRWQGLHRYQPLPPTGSN